MDKRIIRNSGTFIFFAQICTFEQFWAFIYNEARNGGAVYERSNISHIFG